MEPVIATTNKPANSIDDPELSLRWSARLSLTTRILAVNILAIALLAGSLFYLDNYRDELTHERLSQARLQTQIISDALNLQTPENREDLIVSFAADLKSRLRLYDKDGRKIVDSFDLAEPTYELRDPQEQPWQKDVARTLDQSIEFIVISEPITAFSEPKNDKVSAWPELKLLSVDQKSNSAVRYAPDRTPVIIAASYIPSSEHVLLLTSNARDITRIVRAERSNVVLVIFLTALVSILLSLFLARTIVRPIRKLARAAVRVRLGRAPEIAIPRMPGRRDEIGQLARALADMSGALRYRIDATEAFAADVSHEIKNPLASLRSALEGLDRVDDPDLRRQLIDVANDDVRRIDRLINDISEASRVDAELARTKFEKVDVGKMLDQLLAAREQRDTNESVKIAFARPGRGVATIMGDGDRLERVFSNILDNAVSFSPKDGLIEILATPDADEVVIQVSDQGPGIAKEQRQNIFKRFLSDRPAEEAFGKHSGLGLAIAKTIVEGHEGIVKVIDRPDGQQGACFEIRLPKATG
ncbi:ATP-binding protein [Parasphingorhabdus cellanae]|uniref:histidine kinase n=1 Tax=Parasphingorhabdus cellanae TaxID=2806553 RepID=A0ABX7T7F0_9SPHN|nr:ATP-binding protein [Parasphingorhabdus cellanae]QTD56432.1 sensor N-terminal transmembrane domain-containing protein [Parasphingorhabdus cellanae]